MSETLFTPGPWKWIGWNYRDFAQDGYEGELWSETDQCPVLRGTTTEGEDPRVDVVNPFDGHLIAAALDLYAALEQARIVLGEAGSDEHLKQLTDEELGKLWRAVTKSADAALAKARGEEPKP